MNPFELRNPLVRSQLGWDSRGSLDREIVVVRNMAHLRESGLDKGLVLAAKGGLGWKHAYWGVPGGAALEEILEYYTFGSCVTRWFSQLSPDEPGLHPRYPWSVRALRWGGALAGVALPSPVHVPISDPTPIAHWMRRILNTGHTPHLRTSASAAVRVSQAAQDNGISLAGARFTTGGEPVTSLRVAAIRKAGARVYPHYGSTETGVIAQGCLGPAHPDDLHLCDDLHAYIQAGTHAHAAGLRERSLLVSSLRTTTSLVLLNFCLGDEAVMTHGACGCPLHTLGWTTHIHTVRSREKLTVAGMNLLDTDLLNVLDGILPEQFGGNPTDYQLLEEEDSDGRPVLRLLLHPRLGSLDPERVRQAFLTGLGTGSGIRRITAKLWSDAGLIRVDRREPRATAAGKIQHVVPRRTRQRPD